jgi:hypothetical protein
MVRVPEFLTVDWILSQLGKSRSAALASYRACVRDGLESRPWEKLTGRFISKRKLIEKHAHENKKQCEIPRVQLQAARPSLHQIFDRQGDNAIEAASTDYGYRRTEIVSEPSTHGRPSISKIRARKGALYDCKT